MLPLWHRQVALLAICALGWGVFASTVAPLSAWSQTRGETEALAWLRSAATAPRRVSYEGTKTVTIWTGQVRSSHVHVYHAAPDRTRLEYLAAGNQPQRIVVITGRTQMEYVPSRNEVLVRPAPETDEEALRRQILPQILANYAVTFEGTQQVAGREARVVDVRSQFPGRPRLRIWIDTATRLILRVEKYRPDGALREASAFISIQLNPALSPDLFVLTPPPGAQVQTRRGGSNLPIDQIARRVGFTPRLPAYLPAGYQPVRSGVVTVRGRPTAAFAFSDGVSTLTLFESLGAEGAPPNGKRVRIGAAQGTLSQRGVATLLHWNSGGISYTLVGDLRQEELVRVAASIPATGSLDRPWWGAEIGGRLPGFVRMPAAEAAVRAAGSAPETGPPPVPISPYISNDTHPIGPGIRDEEEKIWDVLRTRGLTPFVVKVTVASDGVSKLPDGRLARLAWIWFVYGMDWTGGTASVLGEVRESARALAVTAFAADPRVTQILLTGYYHVSGRFDGSRTDVTFTARVYRDALLGAPAGAAAGPALARAGDVWYSPELLAGTLIERPSRAHDPHFPLGSHQALPVLPGERVAEAGERFQGSFLQRLREEKYRLGGLLFGVESEGRLWRGDPRKRQIALTFDDGPSPLATPLLLAILRRYGVHATFFVIGERARAYPYLVAEMVARGHEVGNHSYHHPNMATVDGKTAAQEIAATVAVIQEAAGRPPRWFRPPGGDYSAWVADTARQDGMGLAMWTANSGDWALPPAKIVVERVLARAESGAIILLHNATLNTVRALPQIIAELRRRGYDLVTVSQLARGAQ